MKPKLAKDLRTTGVYPRRTGVKTQSTGACHAIVELAPHRAVSAAYWDCLCVASKSYHEQLSAATKMAAYMERDSASVAQTIYAEITHKLGVPAANAGTTALDYFGWLAKTFDLTQKPLKPRHRPWPVHKPKL